MDLWAIQQEGSSAVRAWWEETLLGHESIALTWPVITGFLRAATNPRIFTRPLSYDEAIGHVQSWIDRPTLCVVVETDRHWDVLRGLMTKARTTTKLLADADFATFRQLRWVNPLD
ncbi:MAG: PIN domain nuclease [Planctomycetota bacterium]|nr:MAG: PIN domain nuclease [Planctomycetota bacterium]